MTENEKIFEKMKTEYNLNDSDKTECIAHLEYEDTVNENIKRDIANTFKSTKE